VADIGWREIKKTSDMATKYEFLNFGFGGLGGCSSAASPPPPPGRALAFNSNNYLHIVTQAISLLLHTSPGQTLACRTARRTICTMTSCPRANSSEAIPLDRAPSTCMQTFIAVNTWVTSDSMKINSINIKDCSTIPSECFNCSSSRHTTHN
jgi:hypothetical protein